MRATSVTRRVFVAQFFTVHAFALPKSHTCFAFDGLPRLLLHLVSSPCHPCPLDAYAALTGIDYARDRPLEISI